MSRLSNKLISTNNRLYYVLGTVSVDSGYSPDALKSMWALADTVLRNNDVFYVTYEIKDAEFDEL